MGSLIFLTKLCALSNPLLFPLCKSWSRKSSQWLTWQGISQHVVAIFFKFVSGFEMLAWAPLLLNLYKGRWSLLEQVGFRQCLTLAPATSSVWRQLPRDSLGKNAHSASPFLQPSRFSNWLFLPEDYRTNMKQDLKPMGHLPNICFTCHTG